MANKVKVKAKEDFYDKANNTPRTEGQEFVIRKGTEGDLGGKVEVLGDVKEPQPKVAPEPTPKSDGKPVTDDQGQPLVEKVKPAAQAKEAAKPQGKDITMDNITSEEDEPKKAKVPVKKTGKKK